MSTMSSCLYEMLLAMTIRSFFRTNTMQVLAAQEQSIFNPHPHQTSISLFETLDCRKMSCKYFSHVGDAFEQQMRVL